MIKYTGRLRGYKKRRYLHRFGKRITKIVDQAELDLSPDNWFNAWHHHLDWNNLGQESGRWRRFFAGQFYRLIKSYRDQIDESEYDAQIWLMFDLNEAGYDAVFIHTKNPYSEYPMKIKVDRELLEHEVPNEIRCEWAMHYCVTEDQKMICQFPDQAESNKKIQET